jgi:hypothetical protein
MNKLRDSLLKTHETRQTPRCVSTELCAGWNRLAVVCQSALAQAMYRIADRPG